MTCANSAEASTNESPTYFDTLEEVLADARDSYAVPTGDPVEVDWPDGPPHTLLLAFVLPDGQYSGRMIIDVQPEGMAWASWSMCFNTNTPPRGRPQPIDTTREPG